MPSSTSTPSARGLVCVRCAVTDLKLLVTSPRLVECCFPHDYFQLDSENVIRSLETPKAPRVTPQQRGPKAAFSCKGGDMPLPMSGVQIECVYTYNHMCIYIYVCVLHISSLLAYNKNLHLCLAEICDKHVFLKERNYPNCMMVSRYCGGI